MKKTGAPGRCLPPLWLAALAAGLFALMAVQILVWGGSPIDGPVYGAVSHFAGPGLTKVVTAITHLGGPAVLVVLCAAATLLFWKKWGWQPAAVNAGTLVAVALCNKIIKHLVERPRPALEWLVEESGFSFPSGHSSGAVAFYGLLILFVLNRMEGKKRFWISGLLGLLILCIGLSRVYVGVHYASDVLAGWCEGVVWLSVISRIPWVGSAICGPDLPPKKEG